MDIYQLRLNSAIPLKEYQVFLPGLGGPEEVRRAKQRGRINFLMKKFYHFVVKEDESVDAVASELKTIQHSIRETKHIEAPIDLAVAISLISTFENDA